MDHAPRFSGSHTKLRCSTHQASVVWVGVVCSSLRLSRKILGNSRARRKILGVICRKIWENLGFLHHQTASFVGAPITRERRHVTQPRARINVSCSRADHTGSAGPPRRVWEGQQKGGSQTRFPDEGRDRAGQGRHSPEIAD